MDEIKLSDEQILLYAVAYCTYHPSACDFLINTSNLSRLSSRYINKKLSRKEAMKYLNNWVSRGLVTRTFIGGQKENGEVWGRSGYRLNDDAVRLGICRKAMKDVGQYVNSFLK